jgi:VacB/RNase II family 3'-5' exoribonuclease
VAVPAPAGAVRILVAIANVAALFGRSSAIDAHAAHNTTSVYTAAQVFPMLPVRLSTDVSVLAAARERAAMIVELEVDASGNVRASELYPACVVNQAKLAYDSVGAWLEGQQPPPTAITAVVGLDEQLRVQDRVAQSLLRLRHAEGALTLQTLQTRVILDAGMPRELRVDQPNRAKSLIEEFMIAANTATAQFLAGRGYPSVRRVLLPPERWDRIVALAASLHESLPAQPDAGALNAFLVKRRAAEPARFADLSLSIIKLLGRGQYIVESPGSSVSGHFGLAVSDYMHSTAPNRRFPDLLTQRLVLAAIAGVPAPYNLQELQQLAAHCTVQEDNAAKVERQIAKSAAAMLLSTHIGQLFQGMVTGASANGTWIRVTTPPVEGRIVQGYQGLDVGDYAQVRLTHTDVDRGFIDFARVK